MKKYFCTLTLTLLFLTARGAEIVKTFDAPSDDISGLAHNGVSLYASSNSPAKVFKLNPETGQVLSSWDQPLDGAKWVAGAGCAGGQLYVGTWESTGGVANIYRYDQSDQAQGKANVFCWGSPLWSVTGVAGNESNVFISGTDTKRGLCVTRCSPLPLDEYTLQFTNYISQLAGVSTIHDIAYEGKNNTRPDGDIWIACNDASNPIKAFSTSGQVVNEIPSSIGIGASIRGLAFEKGTSRFLWVSNETDRKIYKVDIDGSTGIQNYNTFIGKIPDNIHLNVTEAGIKLYIPYGGHSHVTVSDLKGRQYYSFTSKNSAWYTIPKRSFVRGMNIVQVRHNGKTAVKKFISIK